MFFGRIFESELMPSGAPQIQLAVWVIAFLAGPSTVAPILMSKKYVWLVNNPQALHGSMEADRTLALVLSMIATGLITLVIWEGVFPDRRDGRILGVLPVRLRTFVVARLAALMVLFAMLVIAMTAFSSLAFGAINATFGGTGGFIGRTLSHFAAAAGLEASVFFGIVALQCALLNTVGVRVAQRLAVLLQIALVVGVLQMPLLLPLVSMPQAPAWAPVIGLGMCATTLLLYGASYRRMMRLALEGTGASTARRSVLQRLVPLAASITAFSPPARGVCAFALRTVVRSRHHRMLLAGWVGLAVAIVASTVLPILVRGGWNALDTPRPTLLAVPLVFIALTLAGMRMLFAIPSEIRANWTVRTQQPVPIRQALDGATSALLACAIPPVLLAWISATVLWGPRAGIIHGVFCAALAFLLAQLLAMGLDKVPFTCTYAPGKARFVKLWPVYLTAFSFYTYTTASLEASFLPGRGIYVALATIIVVGAAAAYERHRRASEVPDLQFQGEPMETLTVLSVQS